MTTPAHRLYQWMTEEMSVLPFKKNGKEKIPITVADLEFLVQGEGEKLWMHVRKHVYSRVKVEKIKKNIFLNRLRDAEKGLGFQENDVVGKKLKSLLELRKLRSDIENGRREIENTENKCHQINSAHKLVEYKQQFLRWQSGDTENRVRLLQLASDTIASKVEVCQRSESFFDRFHPDKPKIADSSMNTNFMKPDAPGNTSMFSFCVNNGDMELESKINCQKFISNCTAMAKDMVEEQCGVVIPQKPPKSLQWSSFSSMNQSILTSTPYLAKEGATSKFDAKKMELRKYISENILHMPPQVLHELLLRQTSRGIASLASCKSKDAFKDSFRFLGARNDVAALKSELDKKFTDLYYAITSNMIVTLKERKMASKAEQTLKYLMAQVEKELKEIFTVQTAMVGKAYELVKIEADMASLDGESTYRKEFIQEKSLEMTSHHSGLKEPHTLDEKLLVKSLEKIKAIQEIIQNITLKNHSEFKLVLENMKSPGFLREFKSFFVTCGLINQEIVPFTGYPLDYHARTNVCGKLVPDYQLLSNSTCLQNIQCLGASGIDDAFFESCIKASLGRLPQCSSQNVLLAAFYLKLFQSEAMEKNMPNFFMDDQIMQSLLSKTQDYSLNLKEKEESVEKEMSHCNDNVKSQSEETNRTLDETEFLLNIWSKNALSKCIPKNIVVEEKSYHQWHLEFLAALYKMKDTSNSGQKT